VIPFYDSTPPSSPRSIERQHPCVVVVGPDHVGKSSLLRGLAARGRRVVSCDDDLLEPGYEMLASLRAGWSRAMAAGHAYSRDFLLSGLQLPLVYLRDEMLKRRTRERVVVDSYWYKVLAKCRLYGIDAPRITNAWREFPAPDRVVVLRAPDDVLWERAGRGRHLNPFEYYGEAPTRDGYLAFQRDLVREMLDDAREVPAVAIDAGADLDQVLAAAERAIARDDDEEADDGDDGAPGGGSAKARRAVHRHAAHHVDHAPVERGLAGSSTVEPKKKVSG